MSSPPAIRSPAPARAAVLLLALAGLAGPAVAAPTTPPAGTRDVPIPEKLPAPVGKDSAPQVTIRATDNGDLVEEYRQGGKVYMVHVTPKVGVPYYLYDDDRNGRLDRTDADGKLSPVYYKIYEWD
jgi:hypothetical protein